MPLVPAHTSDTHAFVRSQASADRLYIDDWLDASPALLPLVLLMERAVQLPAEPGAPSSDGSSGGGMPQWLSRIHGSLSSASTPLNARLLLVKAVLHFEARADDRRQTAAAAAPAAAVAAAAEETIFQRHAALFFPCMTATLLPQPAEASGGLDGDAAVSAAKFARDGSRGWFNYMLRDLVMCVLRWKRLAVRGLDGRLAAGPACQTAAESLLRHVVEVSGGAARAEVLKVRGATRVHLECICADGVGIGVAGEPRRNTAWRRFRLAPPPTHVLQAALAGRCGLHQSADGRLGLSRDPDRQVLRLPAAHLAHLAGGQKRGECV